MSIPTLQSLCLSKAKILGSSIDFTKKFPSMRGTSDEIKQYLIEIFKLDTLGKPLYTTYINDKPVMINTNTYKNHPWYNFVKERTVFYGLLHQEMYRTKLGTLSNLILDMK